MRYTFRDGPIVENRLLNCFKSNLTPLPLFKLYILKNPKHIFYM